MHLSEVYVGLGGNIGDSRSILTQAIEMLKSLPSIYQFTLSRFYKTSPVSTIPQDAFINAVCRFTTSLTPQDLLIQLGEIEKFLGKKKKIRDAPRLIDLDILLYGVETINEPNLQIPHPRWSERLFVIAPLADLVKLLNIPDPHNPQLIIQIDLQAYLKNFSNIHHEIVIPLSKMEKSDENHKI